MGELLDGTIRETLNILLTLREEKFRLLHQVEDEDQLCFSVNTGLSSDSSDDEDLEVN